MKAPTVIMRVIARVGLAERRQIFFDSLNILIGLKWSTSECTADLRSERAFGMRLSGQDAKCLNEARLK